MALTPSHGTHHRTAESQGLVGGAPDAADGLSSTMDPCLVGIVRKHPQRVARLAAGPPATGGGARSAVGPASYWAGVRLGALNIVDPLMFVSMLAAGWACLTPALLALARHCCRPASGEAQ